MKALLQGLQRQFNATWMHISLAVQLPYTIAGKEHNYPQGTLVVYVTLDNERAAINYANAVLLPYDRKSVYIKDLGIEPRYV